jgi:23S rRNA pseudouridine955/2504/2580 synthase
MLYENLVTDIITEIMRKKILIVQPVDDQSRIEKFLRKLGISYMMASQMIRKGSVKINGKRQKSSFILQPGDIVEVFGVADAIVDNTTPTKQHEVIAQELIRDILYKDEDILILNKPAGLAVQGGNKVKISIDDLSDCLKFDLENKPKLVHRLDRDTSGVLVMARNNSAAKELSLMFKASGTIKKFYLALCYGYPNKDAGTISIPLTKVKFDKEIMCYSADRGDEAITHYKVIQHNQRFSLIQFQLVTGRTHQVRAHCAISGLPIVGDGKYNREYFERVQSMLLPYEKKQFILNTNPLTQYNHKKLCLHSEMIEFKLFDKKITVNAPLPKDFQVMIDMAFN